MPHPFPTNAILVHSLCQEESTLHHQITDKPQQHILTLKNIYRMLTQPDYPAFSYPVFSKTSLQGQTLVKFWSELFRDALPPGTDLSLFDLSQTRNRSLTRLMNRTGGFYFYEKWYTFLSEQLNTDLLLSLIHAWSRRLEERDYAPQSLTQRLNLFTAEMVRTEDLNSDELTAFFQNLAYALSCHKDSSTGADIPLLFQHSYVLAWLTLYALYGSRMQDMHLTRLRTSSPGVLKLYQTYLQQKHIPSPALLSSRQCVLCTDPLPASEYIGRQALLSQAVDLLLPGHRRLAVTGMRGMGKSEFVRQLLAQLNAHGMYQHLAFIQYKHSLIVSIRKAFPVSRPETDAECLDRVLRLLKSSGENRTLLLIDGLDTIPSEDPGLPILTQSGCDIVITTCLSKLSGFTMMPLPGLSVPESRQLFSLHCLSTANQTRDIDALCAFTAGHPLAIILLASVCRTRFWTAEHLCWKLVRSGFAGLSYVRHAASVSLEDTLSELFDTSCLSPEQASLLQLFSLLPPRSWLPEALLPFAGDICKDSTTLAGLCQMLVDQNWLEVNEKGYAIHPLIASTLRMHAVDADAFRSFLKVLNTEAAADDARIQPFLESALPGIRNLNRDAVQLLTKLETRLPFASRCFIPDHLLESHSMFLSAHRHTRADALDFQAGTAMRDLVQSGRRDRLSESLHSAMALLHNAKKPSSGMESLAFILEQACEDLPDSLCENLLSLIRPQTQDTADSVSFLAASAAVCRACGHDPEKALDMLKNGLELYASLDMHSVVLRSRLQHLTALCLSDLNHRKQAADMLAAVLADMQAEDYRDACCFMLRIRTSRARILMDSGDCEAALHEFRYISSLYQEQYRTDHPDYILMRSTMALTLLRSGKTDEARTIITEILTDETESALSVPGSAVCHRNAAEIFCGAGEYVQARIHAEKAMTLRSSAFGPDSPWTADAQAVFAHVLFCQGQTRHACELMESACRTMAASWHPWNVLLDHARHLLSDMQSAT